MDTDGGQLLPLAMSIAYVCNCGGALRCCHAKLAPPSVAGQWFPARSSLLLTAEVGCGQCELNMNFNEPAELPASFFDAAVVCFRSLDEVARGEVARGEVARRWCASDNEVARGEVGIVSLVEGLWQVDTAWKINISPLGTTETWLTHKGPGQSPTVDFDILKRFKTTNTCLRLACSPEGTKGRRRARRTMMRDHNLFFIKSPGLMELAIPFPEVEFGGPGCALAGPMQSDPPVSWALRDLQNPGQIVALVDHCMQKFMESPDPSPDQKARAAQWRIENEKILNEGIVAADVPEELYLMMQKYIEDRGVQRQWVDEEGEGL